MTLPSPVETPVDSSRGRSDSPRSVSASSGSWSMPLAPAQSGVHPWAHVELCGIMWTKTWNKPFFAARSLAGLWQNFHAFCVESTCGIMRNYVEFWSKSRKGLKVGLFHILFNIISHNFTRLFHAKRVELWSKSRKGLSTKKWLIPRLIPHNSTQFHMSPSMNSRPCRSQWHWPRPWWSWNGSGWVWSTPGRVNWRLNWRGKCHIMCAYFCFTWGWFGGLSCICACTFQTSYKLILCHQSVSACSVVWSCGQSFNIRRGL